MHEYDDVDVPIEVVVDASPGIEPPAYNATAAGDDLKGRHAGKERECDGQGCQPGLRK